MPDKLYTLEVIVNRPFIRKYFIKVHCQDERSAITPVVDFLNSPGDFIHVRDNERNIYVIRKDTIENIYLKNQDKESTEDENATGN